MKGFIMMFCNIHRLMSSPAAIRGIASSNHLQQIQEFTAKHKADQGKLHRKWVGRIFAASGFKNHENISHRYDSQRLTAGFTEADRD